MGTYWEHDGLLYWECRECSKTGIAPFHIRTTEDAPKQDDYEPILTDAEVEHLVATSCKGRLVFEMATRSKVVQFEKP